MFEATVARKADVLWWDDRDAVVRCPYCSSWHRHFVTKAFEDDEDYPSDSEPLERLIEYDQHSQRVATCRFGFDKPYVLDFPLSSYEIERPWESSDPSFNDPTFERKPCKLRFVTAGYLSRDLRWKKEWRNDAPFRFDEEVPTWEGALKELETGEWEYSMAKSAAGKCIHLLFKIEGAWKYRDSLDGDVRWRSRIQSCEEDLRVAKQEYNGALAALLANTGDMEEVNKVRKNAQVSLKAVVREIRHGCREYRLLFLYYKGRAEGEQSANQTKDCPAEDVLDSFARLSLAHESRALQGRIDDPLSPIMDEATKEGIERRLQAIVKPRSRSTVGLLKCGEICKGVVNYKEFVSGMENQSLTDPENGARSLVGKAFDIAEDVGFEFSDTTDRDDEIINVRHWIWRVGQFDACHVEAKAIAHAISSDVFLLKERRGGHPLYRLWKARPPDCVAATVIYVHHKKICDSCSRFIEAVNTALGIRFVAVPCKDEKIFRSRSNSTKTIKMTFGDLPKGMTVRAYLAAQGASTPLPSRAFLSSAALSSRPEETEPTQANIMDQLTGGLSKLTVFMATKTSVSRTYNGEPQFPDAHPPLSQPQTPPRRLSSAQESSMSPRRPSFTFTGSPRSPRKPVVCFNCGGDHYSNSCQSPKSSREQQQKHREEARRQQAEWKSRRSQPQARSDHKREKDTRGATSVSPELRPRRLFGSG